MIPKHAISIWFEGDKLCLAFDENSHQVAIPVERAEVIRNGFGTPLPSQRGWEVLLSILRERYHEATKRVNQIARKSAPIQYMVEQVLKAKAATKRKASPELSLEDLDL